MGALPFLIAVLLGIAFGKLSDKVLTPDKLKKSGRRQLVVSFTFLSSIVLFTNIITSSVGVVILLAISQSAISAAISLNFALANDLTSDSKITGTIMGIVTLGGNIFGLLAPVIVKATGSFNSAFVLAGALLIFGALISLALARKPIVNENENSASSSSAYSNV